MQGDEDGTFHPNAAGHLDIAAHLLDTYLGTTGGTTSMARLRGSLHPAGWLKGCTKKASAVRRRNNGRSKLED